MEIMWSVGSIPMHFRHFFFAIFAAMKALELVAPSTFELVDKPVPQPAGNEVLIRVKACGICGSDIHGANGSSGRRIPPIVMGHEAAGIVESVGKDVSDLKDGDRVTFDSTVFCNDCQFCNSGKTNLCDSRQVMGVSCGEFRRHGAYAEFVSVPAHIVHPLPDKVSFDHAAFTEPVSVAVHAVNRANITAGESAVVVGSGLIGLLVVQAAKKVGCSTIVAVDLVSERLDMATKLGATHAMMATDEDVAEKIHQVCDGRGADHAFEVVGATAPVGLAIDSLRKGGTCVLVGNITADVNFPLQKVVTRELNVLGSCALLSSEILEALAAIADGSIDVEPLISERISLEQAGDWFGKLESGEINCMKVLVCPEL